MDKATVTYAIPDPIYWTFKLALPAPHFGCWLRVNRIDVDVGVGPFCIESHPWQPEPPPDSIGWKQLPHERALIGLFTTFAEAAAWLRGLLHGAAWLEEFHPAKTPGSHMLFLAMTSILTRRLAQKLPDCICHNCLVDFPKVQLVEGWNCSACRSNHDPGRTCCPRALAVANIIADARALFPDPPVVGDPNADSP